MRTASTGRRRGRIVVMLALLGLLTSVLITVGAGTASGTVPGASGKIAYERGGNIWTMNADGSSQKNITDYISLATYHEPAWSPDGKKLALRVHPQIGSFGEDIGVMSGLGGVVTKITATSGIDESEPTWSPDGTKIAYVREGAIWTMDADGSHQKALTSPSTFASHDDPAWSPDGTRIAFRSTAKLVKGGSDIVVVSVRGGLITNLTKTTGVSEYEPTWSPDGKKIAYRRDNNIWTMDSNGGHQSVLTDTLFDNEFEPAWSPDGKKIAYRLDPAFSGNDDIVAVNANGVGTVNLTSTAGIDEFEPAWQPVNRPPVALSNSYATPFETTLTVAEPGVLDNDYDRDADALTVHNPVAVTAANGTVTMSADGSFIYTPNAGFTGDDTFTYKAFDGEVTSNTAATVTIAVSAPGVPTFGDVTVGLVSPVTGEWFLRDPAGTVTSFYFGNPGDYPFMGDWNCNGVDTPGLYRQSDGYVYLRNTNTQGVADVTFFFGNPGDIPIAGDFNNDGCDTVSIYRPSNQRFYIINALGTSDGGLGAADYDFLFGNPGDKPVVGDWDGDGIDEIGLHRESTGFFYYRNTLTTGVADGEFFFGDPGDRFVAGDWGIIDGHDTPAVFRPSNLVFYFRHTMTAGVADAQFTWTGAAATWLPVAGDFGH